MPAFTCDFGMAKLRAKILNGELPKCRGVCYDSFGKCEYWKEVK